jgi:glycosyltransferase involved in cell wall biosynthesis
MSIRLMRLAVYTDYTYGREGAQLYAERAFALFLARLATRFDRFVLIGRLKPNPDRARYPIPPEIEFVGLPYYETLLHPAQVLRSMLVSIRRFWRALDDVDAVWLLGPHPLSIAFAALACARRKRVLLGVRHESAAYIRSRHPGRRVIHLIAGAVDAAYAAIGRRSPMVVVGPALRRRYGRSRSLLELTVSLVEDRDVIEAEAARSRPYNGGLTILSVGRLEQEKNPEMLAEVMAQLCSDDGREWRLVVCGEGPLEETLAARLEELGVADRAELRGYVPADEMREIYRSSHFLLHTSWTEGLPQVLIEAFAAGLPVVATDVGGIREAVDTAAVLVPAGDATEASNALRRLASDSKPRERLIDAAIDHARLHTIDREVDRLATFLTDPGGDAPGRSSAEA